MPPPSRDKDVFEQHTKVLGSFIEADGGFTRESNHRISRAGTVWGKLKRRTDLAHLRLKTKGKLFSASVVSSLLYSTEVRGITANQIRQMQTFVNRCERRLYFGPNGGLEDMKGKLTQVDIKEQLGTLSVHLEVDLRTLRYLGHLVRLPEDRWEHRFLLGLLLEDEHVPSRQMGQDLWWSRVRRLVLEIMKFAPKEDLWVNLANDKKVWRKMLAEWKKHRVSLERQDTQKSRQHKWEEASKRCLNKEFVSNVFLAPNQSLAMALQFSTSQCSCSSTQL